MSEPKREQHPLLCDDLSDDDCRIQESPRFQRRFFSTSSGRAKNHARGAASIIQHWPDHMSSLLAYWWMGLAMIGFTVLIIYNSVLAIAVIPSPSKVNKMPSKIDSAYGHYTPPEYTTVNMHVIVNDLNIDLSDYLPYIDIVAKNHPAFKYNFLILLNDTVGNLNDGRKYYDQRNTMALNLLWGNKTAKSKLSSDSKINVQHKSLKRFMNDSPLKKIWSHLPSRFFGFLIRCITIWNKGGISVNPLLFTPKSPHPQYVEKVSSIFKSFEDTRLRRAGFKKGYKSTKKRKQKVNNIRDIIEALDNNDNDIYEPEKNINLAEAEDRISVIVDRNTQLPARIFSNEQETRNNQSYKKNTPHKLFSNKVLAGEGQVNSHQNENKLMTNKNDSKNEKLFPMLLKFLLTPTVNSHYGYDDNHTTEFMNFGDQNKVDNDFLKPKTWDSEHFSKGIKLPSNSLSKEKYHNSNSLENDHDFDLNIDLKGNIVATKVPCHAFLGTLFNSAIHHIKDETVTDFIIAELSSFCKGTWTSCKGVDVILL